jgi:hypothetical protein
MSSITTILTQGSVNPCPTPDPCTAILATHPDRLIPGVINYDLAAAGFCFRDDDEHLLLLSVVGDVWTYQHDRHGALPGLVVYYGSSDAV